MITNNLKKRFCRDMSLNIQIYEEPYFTERLDLFGYRDKWNNLLELVNNKFNGNEELFFEEYNTVKDKVINYIQESQAFKELNKESMDKYKVDSNITSNDVYKSGNIGKYFISIDMVKANFSSIVRYANKYNYQFNSDDTAIYNYEKFMRRFTDIEYFISSKYIRQVIFGACNPKRQVTYQKYIMSIILDTLLACDVANISKENILSLSNDEIVIDVTNNKSEDIEELKKLLSILGFGIPLHFEYFKLGKVINSDAYIKEISCTKLYMETNSYNSEEEMRKNLEESSSNDIKYVIKKANPIDTVFIQRLLHNQEVTENDLVFSHEGKLAKLIEKPDVQISFEGEK